MGMLSHRYIIRIILQDTFSIRRRLFITKSKLSLKERSLFNTDIKAKTAPKPLRF